MRGPSKSPIRHIFCGHCSSDRVGELDDDTDDDDDDDDFDFDDVMKDRYIFHTKETQLDVNT
jgi:hypothetical protein